MLFKLCDVHFPIFLLSVGEWNKAEFEMLRVFACSCDILWEGDILNEHIELHNNWFSSCFKVQAWFFNDFWKVKISFCWYGKVLYDSRFANLMCKLILWKTKKGLWLCELFYSINIQNPITRFHRCLVNFFVFLHINCENRLDELLTQFFQEN